MILVPLVLVAAGLVGCDPHMFQGPIALKQDESGLSIAICTQGEADAVSALVRGAATHREWQQFWSGEAVVDLAVGDVFVDGVRDGQSYGSYTPIVVDGNTEVDVAFTKRGSAVASAVIAIPASGFPVDAWLRPDGTQSKTPCPDPGPA